MKTMTQQAEGRYLTFSLGQQEYGVEIQKVREILEPSILEPVVNPDSNIRWFARLRGKVVPVVDLRRCLGLEKAGARPNQCVLTVLARGWGEPFLMGLLVDGIREVIQVWGKDLEETPTVEDGDFEQFLLWPILYQNRDVYLLDADVLAVEEEVQQFNWTRG